MKEKNYSSKPLSFNRKMVRASAAVTARKSSFHSITEVDITIPRNILKTHFEKTGKKFSFTGYIVSCLAQVVRQYPGLNSFIRRNKLVLLNNVNISVLIEREFEGESVPEPLVINSASEKTYKQINNEIKSAKSNKSQKLGEAANIKWVNLIPAFLLKTFVKIADKNVKMASKFGKVAITAVGMYSKEPIWFIPHGTATVLVTVGSILNRVVEIDGKFESREHLCLTVSFDHDIVDGAPAARFMNQFIETVKSGKLLRF